jgi:hypothetical protein
MSDDEDLFDGPDDDDFGGDESDKTSDASGGVDDMSTGEASDEGGDTIDVGPIKHRGERVSAEDAKRRAAAKLALKRIERITQLAKKITVNNTKAETAARAQFAGKRSEPPRTPPSHSRCDDTADVIDQAVRRPRREHFACTAMAEAVGFEADSFDARISKSSALEFDIKRVVHTLKTRFSPFSSGKAGAQSLFYTNTALFYSQSTDLCCLWCTEPINGVPFPLPVRYWCNRLNREDWVFHVSGQYCNFACVLAASRARTGNRSDQLTRSLMQKVYGIPFIRDVRPAPDPACLVKFGGKYTTEQFRATGMTGIRTQIAMLPFLPFSAGITEIESIDITISEVGGAELAHRRMRGGVNASGLANPILHTRRNQQRSKFATAPSIKEQLDASDRRLRLQMESLPAQPKKKTLLDFMVKKGS